MIERTTKETTVKAAWNTDNTEVSITGALEGSEPGAAPGREKFAAHMLQALIHWSEANATLLATSKDGILHHVIEDACIGLGQALKASIKGPIARIGSTTIAMDDALVLVALDIIDRPLYAGDLPDELANHMLRSLADAAGITLHVHTIAGKDSHHIIEAAFKGVGVCLGQALTPKAAARSTKGTVK